MKLITAILTRLIISLVPLVLIYTQPSQASQAISLDGCKPEYTIENISNTYTSNQNHYNNFIKSAENILKYYASQYFCKNNHPETYQLNIRFIKLGLNTDDENYSEKNRCLTNCFAEIEINNITREVNARIYWNPRKIIYDHIEIWFGKQPIRYPIEPVDTATYSKLLNILSDNRRSPYGVGRGIKKAEEELGKHIYNDLILLFSTAGYSDKSGLRYNRNLNEIVEASKNIYLKMIENTIKRHFENQYSEQNFRNLHLSEPFHSMYDHNAAVLRTFSNNGGKF